MSSSSVLSFNIVKFSHATDTKDESKNFSWAHVTQGIVATLDTFRSTDGSRYLRILQGTQLLEQLNLDEKILESNKAIEWSQSSGIQLRNEQLPIAALYRSPLIAIRYSIAEANKMRRLQLKFGSEVDFQAALKVLQNAGCRVVPSVPERHQHTSAQNAHDTTSLTYTGAPVSRTSTLIPSNTLSRSEAPAHTTAVRNPHPIDEQTCAPVLLKDSDHMVTAQNDIRSGRINTLPFYQSPGQVQQSSILPEVRPTTSSNYNLTAYASLHEMMSSQFESRLESTNASAASSITQRPATAVSTGASTIQNMPLPEAMCGPDQRPPASTIMSNAHMALQLPPRRELPFKKPASRSSQKKGGSSRPSTASLDMPPLPVPSFAKEPGTSRPNTAVPSTVSSRSRGPPSILDDIANAAPFPSLTRVTTRPDASATVSTTTMRADVTREQDTGIRARRSSDIDINGGHSGVTDPQSENTCVAAAPSTDTTALFDRILSEISTNGLGALSGYGDLPAEQRQTVVTNLVVQHIRDDDFLKLCEDTWGCWQRIALGLE